MLLEAIYYFLPAYIANLVPPLFQWLPILNQPLDFGKTHKGKRIFGAHKTIRGFVVACIFGLLTFLLQKWLYNFSFFQSVSLIDYSSASLWLGFLLGFGAISGDAVKSFFKRRIGVKPGNSWIPFDQTDYVLGAFVFSFIIFIPGWTILLIILLVSPILQLIFHYTGYLLKINKDKI